MSPAYEAEELPSGKSGLTGEHGSGSAAIRSSAGVRHGPHPSPRLRGAHQPSKGHARLWRLLSRLCLSTVPVRPGETCPKNSGPSRPAGTAGDPRAGACRGSVSRTPGWPACRVVGSTYVVATAMPDPRGMPIAVSSLAAATSTTRRPDSDTPTSPVSSIVVPTRLELRQFSRKPAFTQIRARPANLRECIAEGRAHHVRRRCGGGVRPGVCQGGKPVHSSGSVAFMQHSEGLSFVVKTDQGWAEGDDVRRLRRPQTAIAHRKEIRTLRDERFIWRRL